MKSIVEATKCSCHRKMTKLLGIALLGLAAFLMFRNMEGMRTIIRSPAQSLKAQIESDIEQGMIRSGLPKSNGIHHVNIRYRSTDAHDTLKENQPNFETSKNGKIWLEIEVIDLSDETSPGFITQTSVFDVKSNNKIAEFGTTYNLKTFGMNPSTRQRKAN